RGRKLRCGARIGTRGHTPHCGLSRNSALAGSGVAAKLLSAFAQRYSVDSRGLLGIPARARQRIEISLRAQLLIARSRMNFRAAEWQAERLPYNVRSQSGKL